MNRVEELSPEYHHDRFDGEEISLPPRLHPFRKIQTALGNKAMDMGMEDQGLAPGVKGSNDTGFSSDMFFIETELEKGVSHTGKEEVGHSLHVQKPEIIELMGNGKDHVVMGAGEDSLLLFFKPLLYPDPITLRAGSVTAGIVPLSLVVAFRTGLHVAAKFCGAAFYEGFRRLPDIEGKTMGRFICPVCGFHDLLKGCPSHKDHPNDCNLLVLFHEFHSFSATYISYLFV